MTNTLTLDAPPPIKPFARSDTGPRGAVVIGEDWDRPQAVAEREARRRRAKRGVFSTFRSPLARKIILFNLIALVLLVAGILLTGPSREILLKEYERAAITRAETIADLLALQAELLSADGRPGAAGDAAAHAVSPEAARTNWQALALERLTLAPHSEILLLDPEGEVALVARAAESQSRRVPVETAPEPFTPISRALELGLGALRRLVPAAPVPAPNTAELVASLFNAAMSGRSAALTLTQGDQFRVLAAAPVLDRDGQPSGVVVVQDFPDHLRARLRAEREQVLQLFLLVLVVSMGLSLILASTIANPLADLAAAAEIGRDRNARRLSPERVRIPDLTGRPDEIGRLSAALRGMVSALYDRIEANEQFAADVAHEIKNPLASLRSAVGTLRRAQRRDQIERLLDVIEHDVRRIDRLISDTTNVSRLDSELVKEEEEVFDLCKTIRNLSEHLRHEAAEKGIDFIVDLPAEPIVIHGLEARLAQVFVNLLSNAISFCGPGDAVRIWARRRENRVLVVVEDTGPGIPEQSLTKIFKRFYSERPPDQFGNHSGLGLAISKQIVEAHGGVIWAENIRPPGADATTPSLGARFVVGLPV